MRMGTADGRGARPTLEFANGMTLDLVLEGERFLGIGEVRFGRTPLRSAALPWTVYAESEKGFRFDEFRLVEARESADGATVVFDSRGAWLPRVQDADYMGDARVRTRRLAAPVARFTWRFRPVVERIFESEWAGLAMTVEYSCPGHPVNWLLEDATWEIGGTADGCTLIQQDVTSIDLELVARADSEFSTIEKFHAKGGGASYPMDMMPRGAGACPLDFQAKGDVALCLFAERPGLTRARLDKYADEDVIHYADRAFFPLAERARAPERKLLVYRHGGPLARHEARNLWLDCFAEVRSRVLASYGFRPEVPEPNAWAHLWDADLKRLGPAWREPLMRILPEFARLGIRTFMTHGVWESVTSDPERSEKDGNICCPYAFRFAEKFGGAAGMKELIDAAHAAGLRVYQWFGFQFAKFSPLWKEHPEWLLREAGGDPWDGRYEILWCGRMRSPFRDELLTQILKVKADTGLDGIFWDSHQNLGVTCVDWQAPDRAPQAEEIFRLQAELQRAGLAQRPESVSIFGVSSVGVFGFEEDGFRKRLWADAVRGDHFFALIDTSPAFFVDGSPFTRERVSPEMYFRLAAHRSLPSMTADPWHAEGAAALPGAELAEEYARVNRVYNAALPHMKRLRLTEGGRHVVWLDEANEPSVIWAFEDCEVACSGAATRLSDGARLEAERSLDAKAGEVYLLGKR